MKMKNRNQKKFFSQEIVLPQLTKLCRFLPAPGCDKAASRSAAQAARALRAVIESSDFESME